MVKTFFSHSCDMHGRGRGNPCQPSTSGPTTPLSQKKKCGRARVCSINGDRKHCARMAALGVYPGNEIELISPSNGECCLIKVHGGTLSIDRESTENILISE